MVALLLALAGCHPQPAPVAPVGPAAVDMLAEPPAPTLPACAPGSEVGLSSANVCDGLFLRSDHGRACVRCSSASGCTLEGALYCVVGGCTDTACGP